METEIIATFLSQMFQTLATLPANSLDLISNVQHLNLRNPEPKHCFN